MSLALETVRLIAEADNEPSPDDLVLIALGLWGASKVCRMLFTPFIDKKLTGAVQETTQVQAYPSVSLPEGHPERIE